jgi:peptidoglycan hydrolase-like protein with peptidoglycan-binding domain
MISTKFAPAALGLAGFVALAGCSSPNRQTSQSGTYTPAATPVSTMAPVAAAAPEVSPGLMRKIQTALQSDGLYKGRVDGVWGPQTQSAIRGYQQANNLTDNGELDSSTLASLKVANVSAPPPPAPAAPGAVTN